MKRILVTGIATLDIVNTVPAYPEEDAEIRASSHEIRRGGNAANTAVVLAQLEHAVRWLGVLSDDANARCICEAMSSAGVDHRDAPVVKGGAAPTSYVTLSRQTGSRTIVHYRDLRELSYEDFARVGLEDLDWLHFEGRNVDVLPDMIREARRRAPGVPISVEVEKPRPGIEVAAAAADVILCSRVYAQSLGFDDGGSFLAAAAGSEGLFTNGAEAGAPQWNVTGGAGERTEPSTGEDAGAGGGRKPGRPRPGIGVGRRTVFCAWGDNGAWVRDETGAIHHEPPYLPPSVIDTVGAGDVFNAGVIHGLLTGDDVRHTLAQANRLAGKKCGRRGFTGLNRAP